MKYHNDQSFATDSIKIELDIEKLRFLNPELFTLFQRLKYNLRDWGFDSDIEMISEHISFGDSQGAIVAQTDPLLIAAYNEDMDCVVMLKFEPKIQQKYQLQTGDRLVCVNTFYRDDEMQKDLIPGPNNSGIWNWVYPIIVDFVSSSHTIIEKRKQEIGDDGYDYIQRLAANYLKLKKGVFRNGKPSLASEAI